MNDTYQWATVEPRDLELFHSLQGFVPPDAFDAHAHLWQVSDLGSPTPRLAAAGPEQVTRAVYDERMSQWMPERCPTGGLFFPFPTARLDVDSANAFLAGQLIDDHHSRGLMMITPRQEPAAVEKQLLANNFAGFKVYHVFAEREQTLFAPCEEFIPEWAWELADRYELAIMLHLVLPRALAEEQNQTYIRTHCIQYPGAKLVLAHAARGFCGRHTTEGISSLRGLENVFFDTSAVCEPEGFESILQAFGPTRLMFGADFCVTEMRSRCVNLGDAFLWLDELQPDFGRSRFASPTLLGIESLIALRRACQSQRLTDGDVEEVFCNGARRMLGLPLTTHAPEDLSKATPRFDCGERIDVQRAYREAKEVIPGGTQLLSKRPEMFAPDQWPAYYREARGCEVIDLEGRRFTDMSLGGILACILGFSDPDVNDAVIRRVSLGSMATLQTYDEVELARLILEIHPWAQQTRFTRAGGETMAVAVRLARAATGRDKIAFCGYHGWHDWYLAANLPASTNVEGLAVNEDALQGHLLPGLEPTGVPRGLAGTALPFRYNHLEQLDEIITKHPGELAAIVMEPTRQVDPADGVLEGVRERCDRIGAKLIFDEISIGWRLCLGGAHLKFGVNPDLAVFAKTLGNGFPIGAVIGVRETMQAAQDSFVSSTFWTEGVGPAAALACVRKMQRIDVPSHLAKIGGEVIDGWRRIANNRRLPLTIHGRPASPSFALEHPESAALTTLLTQEMLKRGFLAGPAFNPMLAHEPHHVSAYLDALDEVFKELADAISHNDVMRRLAGPVKHHGFARLT